MRDEHLRLSGLVRPPARAVALTLRQAVLQDGDTGRGSGREGDLLESGWAAVFDLDERTEDRRRVSVVEEEVRGRLPFPHLPRLWLANVAQDAPIPERGLTADKDFYGHLTDNRLFSRRGPSRPGGLPREILTP